MKRNFPQAPFERYADDGLVHCRTKGEALCIKERLAERFAECKLELHPVKTRIVYCKDTLWVDKNLKMHGLIQAFSRTNRILNSIKTFGNVICFRNLQKRVDTAISLFGDEDAGGIVLMRSFMDYYNGYKGADGKEYPGYADMVGELQEKFPLTEPQIIGEQNQKDFIAQFGAILRMRNILISFDEFTGKELLEERDLQDYLGRYQDLREGWKHRREKGEPTDITDDVVFEVELIKQIEINIDYILMLVKKYHDTHEEDKEVLVTIRKAMDASPELRSKKGLKMCSGLGS